MLYFYLSFCVVDAGYTHHFISEHWKGVSNNGVTSYKKSWTMPSRDVTRRELVIVRSLVHCGLLCAREPLCPGFETTVINTTTWCHMAMGVVDALSVE